MDGSIFDNRNELTAFSYSTDLLSIFREEKGRKRTIEPGMSPEELSDIISDRLIDIVRRDLGLAPQDTQEQGEQETKAGA